MNKKNGIFYCSDCNKNDLILSLKNDLNVCKSEQKILHNEIQRIRQTTNNEISNEFKKWFSDAEVKFLNYKKLSSHAINNLKEQINILNNEKLGYYNLWKIAQETVSNLETEINQYLTYSMKYIRKQSNSLEQKIVDVTHEESKGKETEMNLEQRETQMKALNKMYNDDIKLDLISEHKEVLIQLKNVQRILCDQRSEVNELKKERDDYKHRLSICLEQNKQFQARESASYAKVQEAVRTVEIAVAQKNAALEKEKDVRDECNRLTEIISRVMEEAGEKFEGNLDELKSTYAKKIQRLEDIVKKLLATKDSLLKNEQMSKKKILELQSNLTKLGKSNELLNLDLQTASKTIVELEMKLKAYDKLIACEQATSKESDERSRQLRDLLDNNVKLKKRWKDIYSEVTEKLQSELFHMQTENAKLIAENQKLKLDLKRLGNKSKLQCDLNILKSTKTLEY